LQPDKCDGIDLVKEGTEEIIPTQLWWPSDSCSGHAANAYWRGPRI